MVFQLGRKLSALQSHELVADLRACRGVGSDGVGTLEMPDGQVVGSVSGQHACYEIGNVVGNVLVKRRFAQHLDTLLAPTGHARIVFASVLR